MPLTLDTAHPTPGAPPHAEQTALILGGRGRLGWAAARAFAEAGWQVLAQVRPGASLQALPAIAGVRWLPVDVHDTAALTAQARGAQVVVHALNPPYTHQAWRDQVPALMDAAIAVTRELHATLMLPGNIYNFGEHMPPVLREDTPQAATGLKGRVRRELEQRIAAATQDGRMRAVVLRAGDFFGSGTGSWLDQSIAKKLPQGRVSWPGPLDVTTSWAYLPDLARTFVRVAEERQGLAAFDGLHFAGHGVTAQHWLGSLTAFAAERGWLPDDGALRVARLNWTLVRVAGWFVPTLAALTSMRYLWHTPYRLDNTRLRTLIGQEPHTPFEQAARQALADLNLTGREPTARSPVGINPPASPDTPA